MRKLFTHFILPVTILFISSFSLAGEAEITQVDIIFDASGSMWGQIDGVPKIQAARKAVNDLAQKLGKNNKLHVALRIYGHLNKECTNSVLEIPMGPLDVQKIHDTVKSINPKGKTPITFSLLQAVKDFKPGLKGEKTIILITDGIESCDGDPCKAALELKKSGIVTKLHIVGFGMEKSALNTLNCITEPFQGMVLGAGNTAELTKAFEKITKTIVSFNLQVTARDDDGKNLLVDYKVFPAGDHDKILKSGDNSMDKKALVSLQPGFYDLKVINRDTGDEIWFKKIEIKKDQLLKKDTVFAQRQVEIKLKDADGKYLYADVYVYDTAGEELKHADTSMGNKAEFTLLPNIYDIKIVDYESKKEVWLKNVDLTTAKTYKKEVTLQ